jgi:hypothetical protein
MMVDVAHPNYYDWSMDARADYGHQIIDVAPLPDGPWPCWTGWYADQIAQPGMHYTNHLGELLYRLLRAGVVTRHGGQYRDQRDELRVAPLHWQLAVDRDPAHDLWSEFVTRRGWWSGRP